MSRIIPQVNETDTFQVWLQRTNSLISELGTTVVTASTVGDTTTGNATLVGSFTANNVTGTTQIRTNVIDTKVGNTSPIDIRGQVEFSSAVQTSVTIDNSLGPRLRFRNNNIAWLAGIRGSAGTGTDAEYVVGVEGTNFALRISTDGTLYANNISLGSQTTTTSGVVLGGRNINTNNGLTGGGNLTQDRTIGLTGTALSLHNLSANGIVAKTGTGSVAARTISPGTGISVSNGDGVAGNPTVSINTGVVMTLNTTQTVSANKTFSGAVTFNNTITGSVSGNAGTVTNGVYTTGNQNIDGTKTFLVAPIVGVTNDGSGARREMLVRSQGYAGIKINGDISNLAGEPGGSYVTFAVDGSAVNAVVGVNNVDNTTGPDGTALASSITTNSLVLATYANNPVYVMTNSGLAATFTTTKNLVVQGSVTASSDVRLKSDVKTIDNAVDKVSGMRGVYFTKDGVKGIGVIAQEVERVFPELVVDDENGYKSVAYGNVVGVLIEAIKELKSELDMLKRGQE